MIVVTVDQFIPQALDYISLVGDGGDGICIVRVNLVIALLVPLPSGSLIVNDYERVDVEVFCAEVGSRLSRPSQNKRPVLLMHHSTAFALVLWAKESLFTATIRDALMP